MRHGGKTGTTGAAPIALVKQSDTRKAADSKGSTQRQPATAARAAGTAGPNQRDAVSDILDLQARFGNAAVTGLLGVQRAPAGAAVKAPADDDLDIPSQQRSAVVSVRWGDFEDFYGNLVAAAARAFGRPEADLWQTFNAPAHWFYDQHKHDDAFKDDQPIRLLIDYSFDPKLGPMSSSAAIGLAPAPKKPPPALKDAKPKPRKVKPEKDMDVASKVLEVAADILQNHLRRGIDALPDRYQGAMQNLYEASIGPNENASAIDGGTRLGLLDAALWGLEPAILALQKDPDNKAWLAAQFTPFVDSLRQKLNIAKAEQRVKRAELTPDNKVIEIAPGDTKAQAAVLAMHIPELIETLKVLNEQTIRFGHDAIHHHADKLFEGEVPPQVKAKWNDPGFLVELQNVLFLLHGILTLRDEEFRHEIAESHGFWNGASNLTELVRAGTEIVMGGAGVALSFSSVIARAAGRGNFANEAMGASRLLGLELANVVAAIEIAHGIAVLLDSSASDQKKVEAVRDIAAGSAWFIGWKAAGATMGFAASTAVMITYWELELMADLYGSARTGIVGGWMNFAFSRMYDDGRSISAEGKELAKASLLAIAEDKPEQLAALREVQRGHAAQLGRLVDGFLDDCAPVDEPIRHIELPGSYKTLIREFAPLLSLRGTSGPDDEAAAATAVLKKIQWCLEHAGELAFEESGYGKRPDRKGAEQHSPARE